MKTKTFSKKLKLNKKTVANLDVAKMKQVKGGCVNTYPSCTVIWCTLRPLPPCIIETNE